MGSRRVHKVVSGYVFSVNCPKMSPVVHNTSQIVSIQANDNKVVLAPSAIVELGRI